MHYSLAISTHALLLTEFGKAGMHVPESQCQLWYAKLAHSVLFSEVITGKRFSKGENNACNRVGAPRGTRSENTSPRPDFGTFRYATALEGLT
jgi:hypothetical protein